MTQMKMYDLDNKKSANDWIQNMFLWKMWKYVKKCEILVFKSIRFPSNIVYVIKTIFNINR